MNKEYFKMGQRMFANAVKDQMNKEAVGPVDSTVGSSIGLLGKWMSLGYKLPQQVIYRASLLGLPAGAAWFAISRAMKTKSQKERRKERELAFFENRLKENTIQ